MKVGIATLLGTFLCLGGYQQTLAKEKPNRVDCSKNQSIQDLLDAGVLNIEFIGICIEDIEISVSGVSLAGGGITPPESVLQGNVDVTGATGVELSNFTVDGTAVAGGYEVLVLDGSYATLSLMNLAAAGLHVARSSGARVLNSTILGTSDDNAAEAFHNSFIEIAGTILTGACMPVLPACEFAVQIGGHSQLHALAGTTINPGPGLALQVIEDSAARLNGATVNGVVSINHRSTVVGFGAAPTLTGAVTLSQGSALTARSGIINNVGSVTCMDVESSISGVVGGTISCSGF